MHNIAIAFVPRSGNPVDDPNWVEPAREELVRILRDMPSWERHDPARVMKRVEDDQYWAADRKTVTLRAVLLAHLKLCLDREVEEEAVDVVPDHAADVDAVRCARVLYVDLRERDPGLSTSGLADQVRQGYGTLSALDDIHEIARCGKEWEYDARGREVLLDCLSKFPSP